MRIAFFLSARNTVPAPKTGGIEQPAYYLMREMVRRGHRAVLYAAPGSKLTGAVVKQISPFNTLAKLKRSHLEERVSGFYDRAALAEIFAISQKDFDLIQFFGFRFYEIAPFAPLAKIPVIIQINYPHDDIFPHLRPGLRRFKNIHYLPMSNFIKKTMPGLNYLPTLYPALDFEDFPLSRQKRRYLLFIGRVCPEKGAHLAIAAARQADKKLIIAGNLSDRDKAYFDSQIKPFVDGQSVQYVGEVGFKAKIKLYRQAIATLFPTQWAEPFGNVLIESMACGTPAIAFDRAAAGEIIRDGVNGLIVPASAKKMAAAVNKAAALEPEKIRNWTKNKFSVEKQTIAYEAICQQLLKNK